MHRTTVLHLIALVLFLVAPSLVAAGDAERQVVAPPGTDLGLPFSPGILAGDFLYLSGAIGNEPGTLEVTGDVATQTRRTMANLGKVLAAAGIDFSQVVSANVYLGDRRRFPAMNEAYVSFFPETKPARATVEADVAIPGAELEIALVAARPGVPMRSIVPDGWPSSPSYSWAIEAGDTLFLAGLVSIDPVTGKPVLGDAARQTEQTMKNVGTVLRAAGLDYGHLVFCGVFLADARDYAAMNEAYAKFFPLAPPARATVRAALVNTDLRVEIQCLAVRGEREVVLPAGEKPGPRPLSPAIRVGDRLFLSGMVGRREGEFPPDVGAQTGVVLDRLDAVLKAAGMDFGDVVAAHVFLSDVRYYQAMNEVYRQRMPERPPARATVGTQLMAPEAWIEIAMTARRAGGEEEGP